ncbi:MAG TPA: hypothetical protein VEL68_09940 [Thermodesulfobacteriota bacterium]|nr:hypothetical protein [Thermodesulfobacteriota bacterium]
MEEFKKILVLENEIEARLLDSVLNERKIPHRVRSYHDSAYDGIFQTQKGWGVMLAPPEYEEEVLSIYQDLPLGEKGAAVENREEG